MAFMEEDTPGSDVLAGYDKATKISPISESSKKEVLDRYGSHPLQRALAQYGDELLDMLILGHCDSVQDCIAYLQEREAV